MDKEQNNSTEIMQKLVQHAMEGKHSNFELVCNINEMRALKVYIRGLKKTLKMFRTLSKALVIAYIDSITAGGDPNAVLALKQFQDCEDFYRVELNTAKDMLREYKMYVKCGHRLQHLLGEERPEDEMFDYRTLDWGI